MKKHPKNMVWFVNKEVSLPSGKTLTALTPQVYLVARNLDVTPQGALISAREIVGNINGDIQNSGTIAGRNLTALSAKNIQNHGVVLGNTVNLNAEQRLVNLGGKIQALDSVTLIGGQGVEIASQTSSSANTGSSGNAFAHTHIDRQADIHTGGKLTVYSPKDVTVKAANLSADIIHIQGNQVELGTVTTHNKQHYNGDADNYYRLDQTQEVGSQLTAKNDVNILSENHTALRQASIHSDNGTVTLSSTHGDVQIQEGRHQEQLSFGAKSTHHGTLQTITSVTKHDHHYDTAQGSAIDGNNILLQANNGNVSVQGSNVVAENHLVATAKNINIQAAENRVFEEDFEKTSKSGLMGSGGLGFSVGSKKEKVEQDRTQESAVSSQVGSLTGNTTLQADNHYQQTGSVVTAVNGNVDILAKSANITAAHSDYESNYKYTYEQKGLTIALSAPVLNMMNAVISTVNSAKNIGASKDDRINALAAANSGWAAYRLAQNAETIGNMASDLMKGNLGSDGAGGTSVGVSITYGQQKNVSTTHTEGNTAQSSEVNAGGKVNIVATDAGRQSDINIIGSDVSGKQGTSLKADNDINLLAAEQTHLERGTNKSSGFNAGATIGTNGIGFTAGRKYGKGYDNGDESTSTYSHVGDKNSQTTFESGATTNLKGAQVQGKGVKLDAQNLNIESLQETLTYKGKQMNVSGQVTAGYGFSASGSYSQSKMNADYASVVEQSGIYASDDGYQVNVQNHTGLKGGLITSSQTAEDNGKNRFETGTLSYSDIQNHADYSGSSFGVGGSFSMGGGDSPKEIGGMKLTSFGQNAMVETVNADGSKTANLEGQMNINKSVGFGYDSEHNDSVTKSGINTVNIQIRDENGQIKKTGQTVNTVLTGIHTNVTTESAVENSGKLEQNFDKEQLQKELNTQLEVTQRFDQNRQELKAEYYATIDKKREEATDIRRKNGGYDTEDSKKLDQEANDLNEQIRWIDMGLGLAWGLGNADMTQLMFGTTQADRAYHSATAPKEMWIQHCSSSQSIGCQSRQIWSLDDLTTEERTRLENEDILVVSNPGIFNDREDALKNAQKQNKSEANQNGIITIMNPPTGDYKGWDGWKLATALPSELLYAFYDKLNDSLFNGLLPLTNSEKLNQDVYLEAKAKNYTLDTSNHSRGGMTASVALQNLNIWRGINDIPIRKARFYGTATNVQAYSNQLNKNGFTYQGKDGKTYQSGAYSAVHHSDGVGLIPVLLGGNSSTGGNCILCYSHSSYFAEIPNEYLIDINGSLIKSSLYEQYEHIWGAINSRKENLSIPTLVEPTNLNGVIDEKAF